MNKELEFLEEKYGHNSWSNYPPSKQQVAQWLKEYTEKQFAICGVSNCNCDNGNDFFEEQYVLQHLINDTWQVIGKKTKTVWKQGTKEICQEWLDL